MTEYLIRRIIMVVPVVLGVSLLVFFMVHFIPGDPVEIMLGDTAQPADIEKLRQDLGLDQPLMVQLGQYVSGLIRGDLGQSLHSRKPVIDILIQRFPATLELTLISMLAAVLLALPLGILSALKANTRIDDTAMFTALLGVSLPNFWLGPMLILLLSVKLDWLPVSGRGGAQYYILPAITLGTALAAILTRMTRSSLLEVLKAQYITTAYAKGASPTRAVLIHALRNSLIPVVTIMGLQFGALLGGSVITETVFSWPGIGRELIQAIQGRDYPVVQGCVLLISLCYVLVNLLTDLTYGFLDPRIQYSARPPVFHSIWHQSVRWIKAFWGWFPGNLVLVLCACLSVVAFSFRSVLGEFLISESILSQGVQSVAKLSILIAPAICMWQWSRTGSSSWRKFIRSSKSMIGVGIAFSFLFLGLFGSSVCSGDPVAVELSQRLDPPSADHLFGMDHLGRDLWSRVIYGARISMMVGVIVTLVSMVIGVSVGMVSAWAGGWIDDLLMRIVDIMLAFPGILLAIAMVAVLGPDIKNVMIALCIMGWVGYARLARGQVLALRDSEYVQAARSLGASPIRIMGRHLLPNILAPIIVQATLGMAGVIIAEAGLSFLGLGTQPPTPSWGGILNSGVEYFRDGAHMTIFPGLAIMVVVMGLNFLGDGLRDALDPRM